MQIVAVTSKNRQIYHNLAQAYEAEFSRIMSKKPDENGIFPLDTELGGPIIGYLCYVDGIPAGHAAIEYGPNEHFEICDFYVIPYFRGQQVGRQFASSLFEQLRGTWEIKQVQGAAHASVFWRSVVNEYTAGHFIDDEYQCPRWGWVTRQRFQHG
ncbi:GNAT family N-acetyltransferase [Vibrio tritonius]|uniref:GNAT family N-acetyltransferase n=1 Tax=Vibrio tritonius TaxID=1435069 RepID=UPI000837D56D|nr:GNAT family N-acetyltransferase [Vibrio tritonius]